MPSSTSNFESPIDGRPLPGKSLTVGIVIALVVCTALLITWEWQWREFGATPSYRNSPGQWALERRRINAGESDATVFIGSSRMFFDMQTPVWASLSGDQPIQLSLEGTSPMGALQQLAADTEFRGTLLVGVTPMLFFNNFAYRGDVFDYPEKETPTQWLGQQISMLIEPWVAFYQPDFALFTMLERQPWPKRDGVKIRLKVRKLANYARDRNAALWSKVENDPEYNSVVRTIWRQNFIPPEARTDKMREQHAKRREEQIANAVEAVNTLQSRGVTVMFVRPPSAGIFDEMERAFQPRELAWDVLLERTGVPGIHYADYPSMQGLELPEWSHLTAADAKRYTAAVHDAVVALQRQSDR